MMPTIGEYTGLADLVFENGRFRKFLYWHDGKERYDSMTAAGFALFSFKTSKRAKGDGNDLDTLRVYPCDVGGVRHFHIGHWRDERFSPHERVNRGKAKNEKRAAVDLEERHEAQSEARREKGEARLSA